jgi:hypothetical protein
MSIEETEFRNWLRKNSDTLRRYAPDEIAVMAITCGFDRETVCGPICDRVTFIRRLMKFWESDLAELWMRARECETGRDEWDDEKEAA